MRVRVHIRSSVQPDKQQEAYAYGDAVHRSRFNSGRPERRRREACKAQRAGFRREARLEQDYRPALDCSARLHASGSSRAPTRASGLILERTSEHRSVILLFETRSAVWKRASARRACERASNYAATAVVRSLACTRTRVTRLAFVAACFAILCRSRNLLLASRLDPTPEFSSFYTASAGSPNTR